MNVPRDGVPDAARRDVGECTVVVWAPAAPRRQAVTSVVSECVTQLSMPHDLDALEATSYTARRAVAVVDTTPHRAGDPAADVVIELLKRKGFTVIGCEQGADTTRLASSCRLLIAGCTTVLDSGSADFAGDLQRHLLAALREALARGDEEDALRQTMGRLGIVGRSPAMLSLFRQAVRLSALSDLSTVITGETGTGKELLARALHALDAKRQGGPFVAVNCAAISPAIAESELFGHRRGAFTNAHRDRQGLFRAADRGVLFLDEVGELAAPLQSKLLRVLQENRVLAVGDDREVAIDVRVIAATNRPLERLVAGGQFRADLFHRLNVISLVIPPLRERRADIPPLVDHFARKHRTLNRAGRVLVQPTLLDALSRLELPGNARQLENVMRWALVHNDGDGPLGLRDLPPEVWTGVLAADIPIASADDHTAKNPAEASSAYPARLLAANSWNLSRSLESCERTLLEIALKHAGGNQSQAARLLGVTPRSVYNKLRRHRST